MFVSVSSPCPHFVPVSAPILTLTGTIWDEYRLTGVEAILAMVFGSVNTVGERSFGRVGLYKYNPVYGFHLSCVSEK